MRLPQAEDLTYASVSLSSDYRVPQGDFFVSNVIDFLQRLGQDAELSRGPRPQLELASVMAPGKKEADEDEDEDDLEDDEDEDEDEDEDDLEDDDEDDFDDDDEDEDDEDEDDEEEDDGEENSLTPRRSPLRRVA
jgi:hypothetical protein